LVLIGIHITAASWRRSSPGSSTPRSRLTAPIVYRPARAQTSECQPAATTQLSGEIGKMRCFAENFAALRPCVNASMHVPE
jgi:hypothetical protein